MNRSRMALRVMGIAVAVIVLTAAAQLLLLSFEADPLITASKIESVSDWLRRRPVPGAAILGGLGLAVLAAGLGAIFVNSFGIDRRTLTTRRREGWTRLDRATLEDAVERELEGVDRRNDVNVRVTRKGRIDTKIVTTETNVGGPSKEIRDALAEMCTERSFPCRVGRISTSVPRRSSRRRSVR